MKYFTILLLVLAIGCSSQVVPERELERDENIARILLKTSDTNNRFRIHEDFASAVDSYLTDVDAILLRTDKRLFNMEKLLRSIDFGLENLKSSLSLRKVVEDYLRESNKMNPFKEGK